MEKQGIPFFIHRYRKRGVFFFGILLFFMIIYMMSGYIWNISLDGNYSYTEDIILEKLQEAGIRHGIRKDKIVGSEIERFIRNSYADITWVSTELRGTRLIIHIKENFDREIAEQESNPYNLVSGKHGIITRIVTRTGTPLVKAGDEVEKDTVLVSGVIEIYGDDAAVMATEYVCSDADVYGKVIYPYEDEFAMNYMAKCYTEKSRKAYSIEILNSQFDFVGFPIRYEQFDMVSQDYQACIFENFYLPLHLISFQYHEYLTENRKYSKDEAKIIAKKNLWQFLKDLEEKGIQIIQNNVTIECNDRKCISKGNIIVEEKLGELQYITEEMKSANENQEENQEGNQEENERD